MDDLNIKDEKVSRNELKSNQRFGTYITMGDIRQDKIDEFGDLARGIRWRFSKKDYNKESNTYDFTSIDNGVLIAKNNGLFLIVQDWNNPKEQLPEYWFKPPFNIPIVTTDDSNVNEFAFYLNSNYVTERDKAEDSLSLHWKSYPDDWQRVIFMQLLSYGTTGDYNFYQGKVIPPVDAVKYDISDTQWSDFVHSSIKRIVDKNKINNPWLQIATNPGNNAHDWDYGIFIGVAGMKDGKLGHGHSENGERIFFKRQWDVLAINPNFIFFSESEGMQNDPNYTKQDFLPVIMSFLTSGGKILSVAKVDKVAAESLAILNTYAGNDEGGFSYMRDVLDYASKDRFFEDVYGPVIDPAKSRSYQNTVKKINEDTTLDQTSKDEKLTDVLAKNINPLRKSKIQIEYEPQGYVFDENSIHERDGGVDLHPGNYEVRLKMKEFEGNYGHRLGDSSLAYGRFYANMIYGSWDYDKTDITEIKITYWDGDGSWILKAAHSVGPTQMSTLVAVINGKKTKKWVTEIFPITGFLKSGINGRDIVISTVRKRIKLQMIEVK